MAETYVAVALPYAKNALEPHISAETVEFHYEKHHKGYAAKLAELANASAEFKGKTAHAIMATAPAGPLRNQAGQLFNHDLYWVGMAAADDAAAHTMDAALAEELAASFDSVDEFKKAFTAAATAHFGSGWVFLVVRADGKLGIESCHDGSNPVIEKTGKPVLVIDVWEHAYYIDRRNRRPEYVAAWWNLVNWTWVANAIKAHKAGVCPFHACSKC